MGVGLGMGAARVQVWVQAWLTEVCVRVRVRAPTLQGNGPHFKSGHPTKRHSESSVCADMALGRQDAIFRDVIFSQVMFRETKPQTLRFNFASVVFDVRVEACSLLICWAGAVLLSCC